MASATQSLCRLSSGSAANAGQHWSLLARRDWLPDPKMNAIGAPLDVQMLRKGLNAFLNQKDAAGLRLGSNKVGVYAFYDYDGEPIYVGQTRESLGQRISRHLTNQRTDAVAMNVLDPYEVAEIEVWPLPGELAERLNAAQHTVFQKLLSESAFGAVLNEAVPPDAGETDLPASYRGRIVPDEVFELRQHPDTRIARRAQTIANLARVISERNVSQGLRTTLLTQARRLEDLSRRRLEELGIDPDWRGAGSPE